jgi:hypothetical protein
MWHMSHVGTCSGSGQHLSKEKHVVLCALCTWCWVLDLLLPGSRSSLLRAYRSGASCCYTQTSSCNCNRSHQQKRHLEKLGDRNTKLAMRLGPWGLAWCSSFVSRLSVIEQSFGRVCGGAGGNVPVRLQPQRSCCHMRCSRRGTRLRHRAWGSAPAPHIWPPLPPPPPICANSSLDARFAQILH